MEAGKSLFIFLQSFVDSQLLLDNVPLMMPLFLVIIKWHLFTLSKYAFIFHELLDLTMYL